MLNSKYTLYVSTISTVYFTHKKWVDPTAGSMLNSKYKCLSFLYHLVFETHVELV
jgi:hypothetical protein